MAIPTEISGFTRQLFGREPTSEELSGGASKSVGELADWLRGGAGGGTRSTAGPDISQVPSALEFAKGLGASEDIVLQALMERMAGQEKPLDIYGRLEAEAGIPELRVTSKTLGQEIAKAEDVLAGIEANVSARTRESIVTEAQRARMVATERLPWLENLSKLTTGLGRVRESISEAMGGIGTKTELALRGAEQELAPFKLRYQASVDRSARLMSGFTADRATQLEQIYAAWSRGNQLSDMQWELANTLAGEERSYIQQLQSAAASAGATITGNESAGQLLSLIGEQAAAEIAWKRKPPGATASEKESQVKRELLTDASQGATLGDLQRKYGDRLSTDEIVQLYTGVGFYGEPTEPYARESLGLPITGGQPEPTTYNEVEGNVINLKNTNASLEDIHTYIRSKGFRPEDFSDILSGYSPQEKPWWQV